MADACLLHDAQSFSFGGGNFPRKPYHKRCDEPPPPGLKGCDQLRWLLQRGKDCVKMRQYYVDKWNDTYPGHRDQIAQRQKAVEDLERRIKKECEPCHPNNES